MKFPAIDPKATGINLRKIMDSRNITVKDLKEYLSLGSIQSIYHWLNGICLPSVDNLYAMSVFFQLPIDALICGNADFPDNKKAYLHNRFNVFSQTQSQKKISLRWEFFPASIYPDYIEILPIV